MPIQSRYSIPIPPVALPTYLFTSPTAPLPKKPLIHSVDPSGPSPLSLYTYRLHAQRFAAGLRNAGFQPGDRLLLYAANNIYFPVVFMGVLMAGGIFTGANPGFTYRELEYQMRDADCAFVLASPEKVSVVRRAAKECQVSHERVLAFDNHLEEPKRELSGALGVAHWSSLLESEETASAYQWPDDPSQPAALNYSSGTTGLPKGVVVTHANLVANAAQITHIDTLGLQEIPGASRERWVACLPMFHAMGQCLYVTVAPKRGIPTWIMEQFNLEEMLKVVQEREITELMIVPPIVVAMAKSPLVDQFDLSSVKSIASGAAPLSEEVCALVRKRSKNGLRIRQGWGMTECTCGVLGFPPSSEPILASVGELLANCEAKLIDLEDDEREVNRGQRGEILVRAPNVTPGYWRNEQATAKVLDEDGWLRTGDVGVVDEEGRWFIVDRIKVKDAVK